LDQVAKEPLDLIEVPGCKPERADPHRAELPLALLPAWEGVVGGEHGVVRQASQLVVDFLEDGDGAVLLQAAAKEQQGPVGERQPGHAGERDRAGVERCLILRVGEYTECAISGLAVELEERPLVSMDGCHRSVGIAAGDDLLEGPPGHPEGMLQHAVEVGRQHRALGQERQERQGTGVQLGRVRLPLEGVGDQPLKLVRV
jgi:hypothetical protein